MVGINLESTGGFPYRIEAKERIRIVDFQRRLMPGRRNDRGNVSRRTSSVNGTIFLHLSSFTWILNV